MTWEDTGKQARKKLLDSIPSEWRLSEEKLPSTDQANVLDFPSKSGLFTEHELSITTSTASHIVRAIASGEWKAVDVTRAFCKRAAVAHQLVCYACRHLTSTLLADFYQDKLPHCNYVRRCHPASGGAGRALQANWEDGGSTARPAHFTQGQFQHCWKDECHRLLCVGRRADAERQHHCLNASRAWSCCVCQD